MLKKLVPLAFVPLLAFAQPAEARRLFWWQMVNPDGTAVSPDVYNDSYAPQDYGAQDGPYGPDPYAANPDEQFNQYQYEQYRREMARRYRARAAAQPDYPPAYDTQGGYGQGGYGQADVGPPPPYAAPVYPVKHKKLVKKLAHAKPVLPKTVATAAVQPGAVTASTTAATTTVAANSTAAAPAAKPAKAGGVSCDKGASIVTSFGFSNVTTKSCTGATLVYGAERSGKPFEIDVSAASGELTAVKKL
ncbi:MAG: hypothetical protein KGO53_11105 [Alphaproteobacteria bacterium]|nr:hypothetical protein [Alphaproteobacteria bacterium]